MKDSKDLEHKEVTNFLLEEFKIRVETYKTYLNIALKANVFFYVTTGAVLGFYFSTTTKPTPFLEFLLLLPILIGAVLGGIFIYAAKLQKEASIIIEKIRRESNKKGLGISELPDINLLYLFLLIFGSIFFLVVISLIIVPNAVNSDPANHKNLWYFTLISVVILCVGMFSMPITHYLDVKFRRTRQSNTSDFSAEEFALEKTGILRLPESQMLPKSFWKEDLKGLIPWKKPCRILNGEEVVNALISDPNEKDIAFWETSAILLLCCSHTSTTESREKQKNHPKIVIWSGTSDEIKSGLGQLKRGDFLSDKQAVEAWRTWEKIYKSSQIVESVERLVEIADTLRKRYRLPRSDSFQLAAALVWCQENPRSRQFITAKGDLAEAAGKEGFTKNVLT